MSTNEPKRVLLVTEAEHATILAALRFYQANGQGDPENRSDDIHDIATNGDSEISLDDQGIDALCEQVNSGGTVGSDEAIEAGLILVNQISRMKMDGEELEDGSEFVMENDDAVDALNGLIGKAREIVAWEERLSSEEPGPIAGLAPTFG